MECWEPKMKLFSKFVALLSMDIESPKTKLNEAS